MIKIPDDFTDFLHWFKDKTENYWAIDPQASSEDIKCKEWIYEAKWIGLTDDILIGKYLDWPFQTILKDVPGENNVWLKSWGEKPDSDKAGAYRLFLYVSDGKNKVATGNIPFYVGNPSQK